MEIKIMLAAAMFLGGFLWVYFLIRQLLFNLRVAYPLLKKMNALKEDLVAVGAWRYTNKYDEDPEYMAQEYYEPGMAPRFALLRKQFGYHGEKSEYSFTWLDPDL